MASSSTESSSNDQSSSSSDDDVEDHDDDDDARTESTGSSAKSSTNSLTNSIDDKRNVVVVDRSQHDVVQQSPSKSAASDIEQCGLLTVNRHRFALEYQPSKDALRKNTAMAMERSKSQASVQVPKVEATTTTATAPNIRKRRLRSSRKCSAADSMLSKLHKPPVERLPDSISICTSHCRYEIIGLVARQLGWRCTRSQDTCNILWTDSIMGVETCRYMRRFQKINHFPGMFEICRKDLLARNMNRMLKLFPKDYTIFPKTWHLPADYGDAVKFARGHRNRTYILKPDQGAQGRGISLTKTLKDISPTEHMICQLYIARPLLIDGFKFDLRVYALITAIDPLRVYVYNEGLARFATSPYCEPKGHNTTNMYMHLTNYSVNKHSRTYSKDDELGSKRKFSTLNRILSSEGYDVVALWNNIDDVVCKTIVSAWPVLRHNYAASFPTHDITNACFEILGVDVIIDQNLKPWLLEVNHSPSFHTDGPVDKEVKHALIRDTFTMLNIRAADKRRVMDEDKRRVNNRLLRKIKEFRSATTNAVKVAASRLSNVANQRLEAIVEVDSIGSVAQGDGAAASSAGFARKSPWLAQIDWEETHTGGFRRVLPVPGDPDKYTVFLDRQNNQASVFAETVASKKREEEAKLQRASLAERERFPVAVKVQRPPLTLAHSDEALLGGSQRKRRGNSSRRLRSMFDGFHMEAVSETEERERVALMTQRDFLVRSCGVLQYIYLGFCRNKLLSEADVKKYESLNTGNTVDYTFETLHHERKLRLKSLSSNGGGAAQNA